MQIWPELISLVQAIRLAATSRSASSATMTGLLPPSSRVTGVRCGAAPSYTLRPISVPPVNSTRSKPCAISSWLTAPSPSITAIASVSRYLGTNSAISADDAGVDLGRLEDDGVPGGDGADGRTERQREREVPRADDQHGAVGLVLHPATARAAARTPASGACGASTYRRVLAASRASLPVLTMSANQASNGLRPRSVASASAMAGFVLGHQFRQRPSTAACATRCCGCGRRRRSRAGGRRCRERQGRPVRVQRVRTEESNRWSWWRSFLTRGAVISAPHVRPDPNQPVGPPIRPASFARATAYAHAFAACRRADTFRSRKGAPRSLAEIGQSFSAVTNVANASSVASANST